MTLRFWDALHRPPIQHPMFRRTVRRYQPVERPVKRPLPIRLGLTIMGLGSLLFGVIAPQILLFSLLTLPMLFSVGFALLYGTLAGAVFATRISSTIAHERERGTLDLIAVSPRGGFEALWAICTGCQYYEQQFRGEGMQHIWYTRLIILVVVFVSGILTLSDRRSFIGDTTEGLIALVISLLVIGFVFEVDDIHSAVIGSLVGLVVPLIAKSRFDARLWAFLVFLTLQACAYLLAWIGGFIAVPLMVEGLRLRGFAVYLAFPLAQFLIFFATREVIARVLGIALTLLTHGDALPLMKKAS